MKQLYILLLIFVFNLGYAQNRLQRLDKTDMETAILFSSFPMIDISEYQSNINTNYTFFQVYKSLAERDLENRFQDIENYKLKSEEDYKNNRISLAALISDFEVIKPDALDNGNVAIDQEGYIIKTNTDSSVFNKKEISIITPLRSKHKGLKVNFNLYDENIINTTSKQITNIKIDFDNGESFKDVTINSNFEVVYSSDGEKLLTFLINFNDGSTKRSQSSLKINYSNEELNSYFNRVITTFQSTNTAPPNLAPYGENNDIGTGEYEIFLSDDNVLDKPIFLVDGFDPGDTRDITGIYDLLNFDDAGTSSNLADVVRAEGFDVVILNFPVYTRTSDNEVIDGGADFIERNAMLLVELIEIINSSKVGSAEQNVIIGPSMGGIISRYALNFMENSGINADTRLWISFDSPHLGANVPIGFQYLFNKIAYGLQLGGLGGDQSIEALRPLVDDFLRSAAAKQMLTDHFDAHITSGTQFDPNLKLPIAHPWHQIFYDAMNALTSSGFPENLRKVSIINGSGIGNPYQDKNGMDIEPDFLSIDIETLQIGSGVTSADADFFSRFTPLAEQENQTGFVFIDAPFLCFCDFTASSNVEANSFSDGIDAAPGGLFDIGGITGDLGSDPVITGFLDGLTTDVFNFIPTVSAMALSNDGEIDWYHIPTNLTTQRTVDNETPFDAWYMPDDNENHVSLNQSNVDFALQEIRNMTLGNQEIDDLVFKFEKNPIDDKLILLSNQNQNADISIIDFTGKIVFKTNTLLSNRISIPINLNSGFYILEVLGEDNSRFATKFIVNK
ncbi:T9SS type A sorting domain-containing protein [Winogradskyella jejuensis]|uniref:Por secretion system C-terminal sorting domain-containing protein n=1 Tax=Winogradskyella jejuensis TaxID=1089305 RepID=A0A1M5L798_9FLAO|nr:T9SS type A sorting domain-containing protein [Winogradskyella jejuensis]SHG60881.1 Por secretion system C-terminal sorting domain-containing protein [Winogradskyella jejuensis]